MAIRRTRALIVGLVAVLASGLVSVLAGTGVAHADSALISVYSPSMDKDIPVKVLKAAGGGPAPTLYLLDGLRAPDDNNGWLIETDVESFFAGKHVNVVIPFGGGGTFYSDWQRDDPKLGRVKWETFLTNELPPVMASQFGSDGVNNAVAGLSMSGTSALNLATHRPDFYKAVASYSGYPTASSPGFAQGIQVSVAQMGGNALNMWGFWPSGAWLRNDPLLNVGALRGKSVYISSGAGSAAGDPTVDPDSASFDPVKFSQTVPLETASGLSSKVFVPAAQRAGAKLQTHITDDGLHTWNYWQDRLHESWANTLAPALGTS
ncbi:alpha/beta hydrolase [Rhodococcus sp. NM-2]|jgi:S-formylglutathione hydrolase FrmB|uniref:Esterase n=2 Tax=Rhodococcus TaxID=1827 RepID=A0A2S8JDU6_RHOOP|nr:MULTISPECIES: alpha/beta hydrolase family protein [Rhodococcus]MDH6289139.1 S-formylglutathione hydrolase FrmB [Rhodococcus opacus]MDI9954315.1 alpha/beta hydrolase family protein [Rhodococcus sp. IEGM 1305]MDI9975064.1 alpha/beta hydrolase family protein [Rhodococcus sp. IEGM 1307]MDV6283196.1 alpha/beta hydrolase family protein [Rhodococcus jostii]PQP25216.1 esterase [Rhodococcus opacus]